jgi:hypothetical protein
LKKVHRHAASVEQLGFDVESAVLWKSAYSALSTGAPGMFGAITGRAEAQVIRLAILYALLDCATSIRAPHLQAALTVWEYCRDSAEYIFGNVTNDGIALRILNFLDLRGEIGATRTELNVLFNRNRTSQEINRALNLLVKKGLASGINENSGDKKRRSERWFSSQVAPAHVTK